VLGAAVIAVWLLNPPAAPNMTVARMVIYLLFPAGSVAPVMTTNLLRCYCS
jgi:hypothetical protein